ncbi:hypothetical protein [Bradyrhizobium sacchari]|uniref:Uncharacterized protein n=1 Tax=Bradyrhizobium sacchari TaxID=1399419 RepID=A0A560IRH3_9BRAD|nr:hypothetical protein [Bradyrhizobium sacchari]TWB59210.1 hypothetical protein FBZ94_105486 [Bradyrhizobium sacchari]TWB72430.1 hypothetical protein FBZ95_106145 [Bradyrhizobium sacchari]
MPIRRPIHPLMSDAAHVEMARDAISKARDVLKQSELDTFLGRKTYKPFPKENTKSNIDDGDGVSPPASSRDG